MFLIKYIFDYVGIFIEQQLLLKAHLKHNPYYIQYILYKYITI